MYQIRDQGGVLRTITAVQIRDQTNVLRTIKMITVRDQNNVLRTVFTNAPAVSASPTYVSGAGYSKTPIAISTSATTVTAPAGSTFAWNAPATGWSAINPTSASTGFRKTTVGAGVEADTSFTCTVTLPGGATTTVTVEADVSNNYESLE